MKQKIEESKIRLFSTFEYKSAEKYGAVLRGVRRFNSPLRYTSDIAKPQHLFIDSSATPPMWAPTYKRNTELSRSFLSVAQSLC
jgi:hypothetical protein